MTEAELLRTEAEEEVQHVGWLRFSGDQQHRHLVVCDSDDQGAFRVYQKQALVAFAQQHAQRHDAEAAQAVCAEVVKIMKTYHEQEQSDYGVDTPGGLEHMGDVWNLFAKWEQMLCPKN